MAGLPVVKIGYCWNGRALRCRLITNADKAAASAVIVRAEPGLEHQATWTVRRDDGQLRAVNFAARAVSEIGETGQREVVVRGITHDIGAADDTPSAPPPMVLAQRVIAAEKEPGKHRAIVNLRTLTLLRWVDEPMPGVAWEKGVEHQPTIHPARLPNRQADIGWAGEGGPGRGCARVRSVAHHQAACTPTVCGGAPLPILDSDAERC
jgi:hypothetical protein